MYINIYPDHKPPKKLDDLIKQTVELIKKEKNNNSVSREVSQYWKGVLAGLRIAKNYLL
jgi:hypothetical protein